MPTERIKLNPMEEPAAAEDVEFARKLLKEAGLDLDAVVKKARDEKKSAVGDTANEKQPANATVELGVDATQQTKGGKRVAQPGKLNTATSVVDLLKSFGEDSDFESRRKMASEMLGIDPADYVGSAKQNMALRKEIKKLGKDGMKNRRGMMGDEEKNRLRDENYRDITPEDEESGLFDEYFAEASSSGERFVPPFSEYKRQRKNQS